ncbi:unnamed protein product [Aphanomyces euteiches]|nr:hypothetical protein Ae201684P_018327 [Aphanomyces euteiches]KAH9153539.1 hypothetical protein AeRB84_004229 [Aphanomyces euteiches]
MSKESLPLVAKQVEPIDVDAASKPHHLLGLGLVAISAFTFSLMSTAVKYESGYMSSMETLFWRGFVAWLFNLVLIFVTKTSLHVDRELAPYVLFRSLIGFASMGLTFCTMSQMVLADASCIIFTSPVMAFLLGSVVLGERIKPLDFGLAIFCFVGVVFVARPAFLFGDDIAAADAASSQGSKWAVLGGLGRSRGGHMSVNFLVVIHYFMLAVSVLPAIWIVTLNGGFTLNLLTSVWLSCFSSGFFGFVGQLCMTKGFQLENVGIASVMRIYSFIGAAIILSSAIAIAIRKAHS